MTDKAQTQKYCPECFSQEIIKTPVGDTLIMYNECKKCKHSWNTQPKSESQTQIWHDGQAGYICDDLLYFYADADIVGYGHASHAGIEDLTGELFYWDRIEKFARVDDLLSQAAKVEILEKNLDEQVKETKLWIQAKNNFQELEIKAQDENKILVAKVEELEKILDKVEKQLQEIASKSENCYRIGCICQPNAQIALNAIAQSTLNNKDA